MSGEYNVRIVVVQMWEGNIRVKALDIGDAANKALGTDFDKYDSFFMTGQDTDILEIHPVKPKKTKKEVKHNEGTH